MALRGYELLLFVRAQNQASATLRRVAGDVNNLKRVTRDGVPVLAGAERVQQQGRLIAHAGRTAQLAGLAVAAGFGVAAKGAADFNTEVTLAASQARDLDAPLAQIVGRTEQIDDQIKGLMGTFPAASEEMTASAYEIYSGINLFNGSLVDTGRALDAMTLANKAAVAGQTDLASSTSLLITLANNFGDESDQMARSMDTAFDIIRFGRLRVEDLNDMMNKVAPAAKAAGQSLEDLSGATAYLTTVIPSHKQVATGLSRLLDVLRHPDMVEGFKKFGVEVLDASGKARPFMEVMQDIIDTFPEVARGEVNVANFFRTISQRGRLARTGAPGLGLVSTIEGRRIFTQLATGWDGVIERQNQVIRNTGELETAYEALSQSAGVRFKTFTNNLKRQFLDVGKNVLPVFEEIGGHLGRLSKWWDSLDESQRRNIARWGVYAGIALVVAGALSAVVGALTAMVGTLAIFLRIGAPAAGTLGKMAGAAALLFGKRGINPFTIGIMRRMVGMLPMFQRLAQIGAISLIVKAGLTGDPTAIQLLQGALTGAVAGSAFGPYGALAGAIVVPVAMRVAPMLNRGDKSAFDRLIVKEFNADFEAAVAKGGDNIRDNWTRMLSSLHLFNIFKAETADDFQKAITHARDVGYITGEEYARGIVLGMQSGIINQAQADVLSAIAVHDPASSVGQIERQNAKRAVKQTKDTTKSNLAVWDKYFSDLAKFRNADKEHARAAADVVGDATRAAVDELSSFLIGKYKEMEDANRQFMGQLFQGEWLTGEAARLSEEWGIKPMAKDLLKDLKMQLAEFNRFNSALAAIAKRGAPQELMDELKALGPAGLDSIEALRKASPEQFNAIVRAYKQRQAAIKKQTQIDFAAQLKLWKQHGGNMMSAIIQGLTAEQGQLENYFRTMVTTWFPEFVSSEVRQAQLAAARNADPDAPKKPTMPSVADPRHRDKRTGKALPTVTVKEGDVSVTVFQQPGESSVDVHRRAALQLKAKVRSSKAKGKRNQAAEDWGITGTNRPKQKPRPNRAKGT